MEGKRTSPVDGSRSSVDESTSKEDDKNLILPAELPTDVSSRPASRSHDETDWVVYGSRKQSGESNIPIQSESEVKTSVSLDEDSHHEVTSLQPQQYSEKILKKTEEKISRIEDNVNELSKKVENILQSRAPLKGATKPQHPVVGEHTKGNALANRSLPSIGSTNASESSVRTGSVSPQDATSEDNFTSSSHNLVVQSSLSASLIHANESIKEIEERVSQIEGNFKKLETAITDLKTLETTVTDLNKNVATLQQNIAGATLQNHTVERQEDSLSRNTSCNLSSILTGSSRESPQTGSLSPQDTMNLSQSSSNFQELTSENNFSQSLPVQPHTASLTAAATVS